MLKFILAIFLLTIGQAFCAVNCEGLPTLKNAKGNSLCVGVEVLTPWAVGVADEVLVDQAEVVVHFSHMGSSSVYRADELSVEISSPSPATKPGTIVLFLEGGRVPRVGKVHKHFDNGKASIYKYGSTSSKTALSKSDELISRIRCANGFCEKDSVQVATTGDTGVVKYVFKNKLLAIQLSNQSVLLYKPWQLTHR